MAHDRLLLAGKQSKSMHMGCGEVHVAMGDKSTVAGVGFRNNERAAFPEVHPLEGWTGQQTRLHMTLLSRGSGSGAYDHRSGTACPKVQTGYFLLQWFIGRSCPSRNEKACMSTGHGPKSAS